ncbi:MAG: hypothetical protein PHU44_08655, partial [Syntrophales bacterium]|nr:hypothetical protein [Syntrophales bacterium]
MKKQQKIKKGRPRGRPFKPGQSGNPAGRPKGAKNKFSLMVLAANEPIFLDRNRPFEVWSDRYVQDGREFRKDTLQEINPGNPTPVQPEIMDKKKPRTEIIWRGQPYFLQDG